MTQPLHKAFTKVDLKADEEGAFRAVFSTFNVVDHDGDVTVPGAFPEGKEVLVSAYMHGSWMGALPVGKGLIGQDEKEAWIDGNFFLDTADGLNTYRTVKAVGGLQEWSYGYDIRRSSDDAADIEEYPGAVQLLQELDPYEVSPVLLGAGIGTHTDFVKALKPDGGSLDPGALVKAIEGYLDAAALLSELEGFLDRGKARAEMRAKEGRTLSTANRDRLSSVSAALQKALTDIQELLDATDPEAGKADELPEEILAIYVENERRRLAFA